MKYSLFLLCGIVLLALGCADTEQPDSVVSPVSPDVPDTEVLTTETRLEAMLENMTEGERGLQALSHAKAYLQLKQQNLEAAYAELEKSAYFTWLGHPRHKDWALLVFRLDSAGEASISEMIGLFKLELEMARDRSPYKNHVTHLEGRLESWEAKKADAVAFGKDPDDIFTKYSVNVRED